jgi:hypothetical protein
MLAVLEKNTDSKKKKEKQGPQLFIACGGESLGST